MDYFRNKYRAGLIDVKTYERMIEIVYHMGSNGYRFVEVIGGGSFGSVWKVMQETSGEAKAVKIVAKNRVTEGEMEVWATLEHQNILSLISSELVYYANSYIFITDVHPSTLEQEIVKFSSRKDPAAFSEAVGWLRNILDAVAYLHGRNLSHMDLKCDNVLISEDRKAVLADFGFVTSCVKPVSSYGAPLLYRCPEACRTDFGYSEVDGKSFDTWTLGSIAFELFTGMHLLRQVAKLKCRPVSWYSHIYPILQENLQRKTFLDLMQKTFPSSPEMEGKLDVVVNFITSCLTVVHVKRPSVRLLQKHQLFGGTFEKILVEPHEDVWSKRATVEELNDIHQKNFQGITNSNSDTEKNDSQSNDTPMTVDCAEEMLCVQSIGNKINSDIINDEPIEPTEMDLESAAPCSKKQSSLLLHENPITESTTQEKEESPEQDIPSPQHSVQSVESSINSDTINDEPAIPTEIDLESAASVAEKQSSLSSHENPIPDSAIQEIQESPDEYVPSPQHSSTTHSDTADPTNIDLESVASVVKKQSSLSFDENPILDSEIQEIEDRSLDQDVPSPQHGSKTHSDTAATSEMKDSTSGRNSPPAVTEIESISDLPDESTCCQKIRVWWRRTKAAIVRVFTSCFPVHNHRALMKNK